ncbi:aspartate aminotransferase family protein [Vibrio paucivorans]
MSHILHRHCKSKLPQISHGQGSYLYDTTGKQYLDACGGAAVSCLGHNAPRVKQAITEQLDSIPYAHTGFFSNQSSEELAQLLCGLAPDSLNHAYFVSGGSEAVESAIKMARQYFVELGQNSKRHIISRKQSYHGNTLGALSIGGNMWRREPYEPLLTTSHRISPCYPYREQYTNESVAEYSERTANGLEKRILELGPDNVMAFIAEPVVGATSGALVPTEGYFARIREICTKYNVLLILDEVMCGVGRTGSFYAFEQENIVPDIVTIAKGLAAGYQAIGAVLVSDQIYQAFHDGSGYFQHGHTFMAHPMASAAGVATVKTIMEDHLLEQVRTKGVLLKNTLHERLGELPYIGDIRGRGLFIGIELVEDRPSKRQYNPQLQLNKRIKSQAMANGLMVYPMGGTIDGKQGDHILLAPPYIITEAEIEILVDKLSLTLEQVFSDLPELTHD